MGQALCISQFSHNNAYQYEDGVLPFKIEKVSTVYISRQVRYKSEECVKYEH